MSGPRVWLRKTAWYFGIGSAPDAERRRLELDEEEERRPWWREAISIVVPIALWEILRHDVGFAHAIADLVVVGAIMAAVNAGTTFIERWRQSERPRVG